MATTTETITTAIRTRRRLESRAGGELSSIRLIIPPSRDDEATRVPHDPRRTSVVSWLDGRLEEPPASVVPVADCGYEHAEPIADERMPGRAVRDDE
jgi:hypothetical protein